jgi:arylsulfatase A-like enzyme/Flp pilus assembly protein TadD
LRAAVVLIAMLTLAACNRAEHPAAAAVAPSGDRPDIILITIDTLRADSVGFAGNTRVNTPFLDSLAAQGIVFTNAHAHNVVTLPSHVNILTGLYPYQHGVRDNAGFMLDAKHATVAKMLHDAGYATGAFVGAFPLDARFGLNQGFDVYDDNYGKGAASLDFVIQERPAAAVLDAAMKWWHGAEGKKRFLWIHVYDPHAPYRPPEPFASRYRDDPYLGEIAAVDSALGNALTPILAADPKTLVVVTGDHGEARGDHGELTHGLFAYESTLKIPLVVRDGITRHRSEPAYVRHIDIVPTLLARAGIAKPSPLLGASLLQPIDARDTYFESLSTSLNRGWAPLTGIIHGGEKYIELPLSELYDLPHDPAEKTNLRDERRRNADAARKLLAGLHVETAAANRNISAEEAARLRSLGYIAGSSDATNAFTPADDPKNLVALDNKMHEVIAVYEQNDMPRALRLAKEVVAERPKMAAGRELLAFVLQQSERVGDAIANLREAMKTNDSVRVQLGLLLTETGQTQEALTTLAPLAGGNNPDALNAYGIALADSGRLDDAVAQFQRVLQLDANNAPALQNIGIVALRRDDAEGAKQLLTQALALNPRLPLALNTLGVVYARMNDFPRAVEYWKRAVDVDPRQYDALFNIGIAEGRAGHREEARAAFRRFIDTAPQARYAADIATARAAMQQLQ